MKSPVEQFTIKTLVPLEAFGYDISFTNASLFMVLSVIVSSLFLYLGIKKSSLIDKLHKLLSSPNIVSKEFIATQYDHEVQATSII